MTGEKQNRDRRNFLRHLVGGVAAAAAVRTFPFRVISFRSQLVLTVATLREMKKSPMGSSVEPWPGPGIWVSYGFKFPVARPPVTGHQAPVTRFS